MPAVSRAVHLTVAILAALALTACGSQPDAGAGGTSKPADAAKPAEGAKAAEAPKPAGGPPPALPVKVAPVRVGEFSTDVTAVGSVLAQESVLIRSEIDGRVTALPFVEGQPVRKGQKLVGFDASEWEATLAASVADLRTKQTDWERGKDLLAQNFVSKEAVDRLRGAVEVAQARMQADKARLAKTAIFAPFDGTAGLRVISPGAYVKTGDAIVRIESLGAVKVDFRVPEVFIGRLQRGQVVRVSMDAYADEHFEGRIVALEPAVDEKSRTVLARAEVPNPKGLLRPGLFARVAVQLETRPGALIIPEQAVVPQGRDAFVYRLGDGNTTQMVKIELGGRRPGEVEVLGGLAAGDVVVAEGAMKLGMMPPGAPVTPLPLGGGAPKPAAAGAADKAAAPAPAAPTAPEKKG
jgi:membrane fusion protein (multidrug efflux system)